MKLAEYGAIVRLQGGKTGLIHISEIADTFVRDVHDYFKEHDRVCVRVLSVNHKGRYELSTKGIEQPVIETPPPREHKRPPEQKVELIDLGPDNGSSPHGESQLLGGFEDQLSRFLKDSQERQLDIRRNLEAKRGFARKR